MTKTLFLAAILGGAAYHFLGPQPDVIEIPSVAAANTYGFVPAAMPKGARDDTVYILAPVNCTREAAARASSLEKALKAKGVSVVRSARGQIAGKEHTPEAFALVNSSINVINGEIPAVFYNDMASSNPSFQQVLAQISTDRARR